MLTETWTLNLFDECVVFFKTTRCLFLQVCVIIGKNAVQCSSYSLRIVNCPVLSPQVCVCVRQLAKLYKKIWAGTWSASVDRSAGCRGFRVRSLEVRLSKEVVFRLMAKYGIFRAVYGIPRNSRNSAAFWLWNFTECSEIPCIFASWIPYVRFIQFPPIVLKNNKKFIENCTVCST